MRIACGVEYDGARFYGWQRQAPGVRTVQQEIERALSRVANERVSVVCAGRTDSGVHATTQVFHCDPTAVRSEKAWVMGTNTALPNDVAVRWAKSVPGRFHARYSAMSRTYRYVVLEGWQPSALWRERCAWYHGHHDTEAMQEGARYLLGEQDFSSFRSAACQAHHPIRRLDRIDIARTGAAVTLDIQGNAFLHNMVRIMAGVLMTVGRHERTPDWVGEVLAARDRRKATMTAPATGLFFVGPQYAAEFGLPDPEPPLWPGAPK